MRKCYTFDDVALVPQYNDVPSRTIPELSTDLTKKTKIQMPLLAANMDTVINDQLADVLLEQGSLPIYHRFSDFEDQKRWVQKYEDKTFISSGVNQLEKTQELLDLGARGVCFDTAHGHSKLMLAYIEKIKASHPHCEVIAGNICTAIGYHDLVNAGADAVKVGIGPGAACTTRIVTGFGVPQFSAITECARLARKLKVPIIADGGIRNSRDVVLALAAGANSVMIGKLFAMTEESAAPKEKTDNQTYIKYRGQASKDFQDEFYGGLKEKTVAEGTAFKVPVIGKAEDLVHDLLGGVRSGMTYGGACDIGELQTKAEFVIVTSNYMSESKPRGS
jgi:IMP dehydrogenase